MDEVMDLTPNFDTAEQLELYRVYAEEQLNAGAEILNFSDFRNMMNE